MFSTMVDVPEMPDAITTTSNKRYSAFKNARAPSLILLDIGYIF